MNERRAASTPASVLILGAGGLGCPAALALGAAGVTRIGIVDDDRVDASNLHRQVLFADADVGELKVTAFARALARRYPALRVEPHAVRFEVGNAEALLAPYDVIVDGTDNFAAKFLANDAAVLAGKPLVHGAAVGARRPAADRPGRWSPLLPLPVRGAAPRGRRPLLRGGRGSGAGARRHRGPPGGGSRPAGQRRNSRFRRAPGPV